MSEPAELLVERPQDGVLLLTINRPKVRNAFSNSFLTLLADTFRAAQTDAGVRCVVITGGPDIFAAGSDINELKTRPMWGGVADQRFNDWDSVEAFSKPVIAAVNGYALGGGCELAMLADFVIAGDSAKFGLPELKLGLIPGLGGTQRLVRAVGKPLAMKLILTAEFIDAPTALAAGLVAEVVPAAQTIPRALELAGKVAEMAPLAAWAAKEAINQAFETTLSAGLLFERKSTVQLYPSEDKQEGLNAFLEKRKPVFKGK